MRCVEAAAETAWYGPRQATTDEAGDVELGPFGLDAVAGLQDSQALITLSCGVGSTSMISFRYADLLAAYLARESEAGSDESPATLWLSRTLQHPSSALRVGVVRSAEGTPVGGAEIVYDGAKRATSDSLGRFVVHGRGPAPLHAVLRSPDGAVTARSNTVDAGASTETIELRLPAASQLEGVVTLPTGAPLADLEVFAVTAGSLPTRASLGLARREVHAGVSDAAGRLSVYRLPSELIDLVILDGSGQPQVVAGSVRAGTKDLELVVERHRIHLACIDAGSGSAIVTRIRCGVVRGRRSSALEYARAPASAGFVGAPGDLLAFVVEADGYASRRFELEVQGAPYLREHTVELTPAVPDEASVLVIEAVDLEGTSVRVSSVSVRDAGAGFPLEPITVAREGRLELWGLPQADVEVRLGSTTRSVSGPYALSTRRVVSVPAEGRATASFVVGIGGCIQISLRGELSPGDQAERLGDVSWVLADRDGDAVDVHWRPGPTGAEVLRASPLAGGVFQSTSIPPGTYRLYGEGDGWREHSAWVTVEPGETTRVEIEMLTDL